MANGQTGGAQAGRRKPRTGYWFPLLVWGGLATLSLPLSVLGDGPMSSTAMLVGASHSTVTGAMYLGGGSFTPPTPFPLGWYWVGALLAGSLITAAWIRWRERAGGTRTPLRGYLMTGLILAALTAAVPLLAWGTSIEAASTQQWMWLEDFWRLGTTALLAIAVSLAALAWRWRSRALAVVTSVYAVAVCLAGLLGMQEGLAFAVTYPDADPGVVLPAAVLLVTGLGALLAAGLRSVRSAA
jgi:hypothetical protein